MFPPFCARVPAIERLLGSVVCIPSESDLSVAAPPVVLRLILPYHILWERELEHCARMFSRDGFVKRLLAAALRGAAWELRITWKLAEPAVAMFTRTATN